jgi:uncharacterized membrane protein
MTNDSRISDQPPATLDLAASLGTAGSIENAVAGRYDFEVGEVMSEAWGLVKGFKGTFWAAGIVIYLMTIVSILIWTRISMAIFSGHPGTIGPAIFNGLIGAFMAPLYVGMTALVVRRASGMPATFSTAFGYLGKVPLLFVSGLLTMLMTYLGLVVLIIPGLYLGVAYGMTIPLIAFNELGAWQAMEISRQAITHKWFNVFALNLAVVFVVFLSALPLGIGLIWTMPWAMLVLGVLYRRMFGAPAASA